MLGLFGEPILEDDYFRYLWDGYRVLSDGNPYGQAPEAWFDDPQLPAAMQQVLSGINYPDVPTAYGPVQQALFGLAAWMQPGALWPLKLLLLAMDLVLLVALWQLGAPRGAWLYALHPLAIKEVAFTAHPDSACVSFLVLALLARQHRQAWLAGACCGLALAGKVLALPLIPLLLWGMPLRSWFGAGLAVMLAYLPFLHSGSDLQGLGVFSEQWIFNPLGFGLAAWALGPDLGRIATTLLYAALWLGLLLRHRRSPTPTLALPPLDWAMAALLLLSPVVNPWYALWLLPFAALRPASGLWWLAAGPMLSYVHAPGDYHLPAWVPLSEAAAIAVWALWLRRQPPRSPAPTTADGLLN
jgi:hypothetical protein